VTEEERRARLIEMLEANHSFPGPFSLAVVTKNEDAIRTTLRSVIEAMLHDPLLDEHWVQQPSATGKFVSHRVTIVCRDADHVLTIYAAVQSVQGVIQIL
jgi:putative lipoic acid-binding regulatory protein